MTFCLRLGFIFLTLLLSMGAKGDVKASKGNAYSVIGPPANGVSSSKSNAYSIVGPPSNGVSSSKSNAYSIVGTPRDVSSSKTIGYVVMGTAPGVSSSKKNAYVITGPARDVAATKMVAYVVLSPPSSTQPNIFIITKDQKNQKKSPLSLLKDLYLGAYESLKEIAARF